MVPWWISLAGVPLSFGVGYLIGRGAARRPRPPAQLVWRTTRRSWRTGPVAPPAPPCDPDFVQFDWSADANRRRLGRLGQ